MLKYDIRENVYYLQNSKIHTGIVIARKFSDRIRDDILYNLYTDGPRNDWIDRVMGGGFTNIYIVHDDADRENYQFDESELFSTKEELVSSL